MNILLGTICLNEMEFLPKLYEQHKNWPGLVSWVFVEGADQAYAHANSDLVSPDGLSVDGTSEWLEELARQDNRVVYIKQGIAKHPDIAQGKCAMRTRYLEVANAIRPDFIMMMDADEFVCYKDQDEINQRLIGCSTRYTAMCFGMRSIWRPASIADQPLFRYEAVGGLWSLAHCRGWRFVPGMEHRQNHNWPEANGKLLNQPMMRYDMMRGYCPPHIHMGFASVPKHRVAKTNYYAARGEGVVDQRGDYMTARRLFETWKPEDGWELKTEIGTSKARVVQYNGPIPECYQ